MVEIVKVPGHVTSLFIDRCQNLSMKVSSPCLAGSEAQILISNDSGNFQRARDLVSAMHADMAKAT